MPMKRYSPRDIESMKRLKALRAKGRGEDPEIDNLPDLPELPTGEGTVAIFIPGEAESPEDVQDEELIEDEPEDDENVSPIG